jgi:site-specific recombinase XerD
MVSKTFSILFYFKSGKTSAKGTLPIYMRITIDGQRVELSTKREWTPGRWSAVAGRATGTKEDAKAINAYLDTLQVKVHEIHRSLINDEQQISAQKIKEKLLGVSERPKMILEIFEEHNKQLEQLVGNGYAPLTLKRYRTALRHAREFIKYKYRLKDLDISKLNYEFISEYDFYLKSVRKCGHNSTIKYLRNFKKIVLLCVKKGWLNKDPFYGFKLANKEVVRDFLTQQELDTMANKEFAAVRLTIVRDIFLFSCYTGLAYVDVRKLKRSEIGIGMDGEKWIFTSRQKTEVPSRVPLLPVCLDIIKRYEDHQQCVIRNTVLPVWSNQKMNEYLKEIADVCGINKRLTYHIARHTFATTVTLNNGVPIETVARMLGHKSLRTTQHYAKILDKKVSEDMQILKDKLVKRSML